MVLYRVSDLVRSDGDSGQRAAIMLVRRQAYDLFDWIVMVARFRWLNLDGLQSVLVQQMSRQARAGSSVAIFRATVFLEYVLHPNAGPENGDQNQHDEDDDTHAAMVSRPLFNCRKVGWLFLRGFA